MHRPPDLDAEALRRRLYRPGATEDDVGRYAASIPEPGAPPPEEPERPRRRPRPAALLLGGVLVAAVAAVGVLPALRAPEPAVRRAAAPAVTPLPTDRPDILWADAGTVLTYRGSGPTTVPLETSVAPRDGTMSVAVAPWERSSVTWRAFRSGAPSGGSSDRVRMRPDRGDDGVPLQLDYRGLPPDRVAIDAPDGQHWTLVVTFLRGRTPA